MKEGYDKEMELYEVYNHLDSIASYCRSMIEEPGDIWSEDLIACRIAQACVEEIMAGSAPVAHAHNESETGFLCSACKFGDFGQFNHGGKYTPNYCPNCGAKMDERGEKINDT